MIVGCIASGPTLTKELVYLAAKKCEYLVMVSDAFRLAQYDSDLLHLVAYHVSTDVRWWNEWRGRDFGNRVQWGDIKPFTGHGSTPTPWKDRTHVPGYKKLHSGALGLMVAASMVSDGDTISLISHDLELKDPGKAHFFGNHPNHPGWGTPNPTEGNLPLYRNQMHSCREILKLRGVRVVCSTQSSLTDKKVMGHRVFELVDLSTLE